MGDALKPQELIHLLEETRAALAMLDPDAKDPGIGAVLTVGWEEEHLPPREWSPRSGGPITRPEHVREILTSMEMELSQSDRNEERDVISVALLIVLRAIETIKKKLRVPDRKFLKALAVQDFKNEKGRRPNLGRDK